MVSRKQSPATTKYNYRLFIRVAGNRAIIESKIKTARSRCAHTGAHGEAAGIRQMSDRSPPTEEQSRVIPFRPRGKSASRWRWPGQRPHPDGTPVADLSKFERTGGEDDYRHRMAMNTLALVIITVLIVSGVWLATSIAEMRKNQDCVLQGRHNCAQIMITPAER